MPSRGRYRLRTELRGILPDALMFLVPKGSDCQAHEWYYAGGDLDRCYHCKAGSRGHDPSASEAPVLDLPPHAVPLGRKTAIR